MVLVSLCMYGVEIILQIPVETSQTTLSPILKFHWPNSGLQYYGPTKIIAP